MNQETLTQANDNDEMEIDLLEVFYYLKARAIWLFVAFMAGAVLVGGFTAFFIAPNNNTSLLKVAYPSLFQGFRDFSASLHWLTLHHISLRKRCSIWCTLLYLVHQLNLIKRELSFPFHLLVSC